MAVGELRDWSDDDEVEAKIAECWTDMQINAGWQYLTRRGGQA